MKRLEELLLRNSWLIVIFFSLPVVWALFVPGFYGASDDIHIAWLHQMDATIKAGKFPPRFVPDLSFRFGYPLFNFVFPLPFYVGEIFHLVGLSFVDSIKVVFILSVPISAYLMYRLLREFTGAILSMAGAVLYIYTPYRSTDIYVRGAIGEVVAFIFLPLVVWAIVKLTKETSSSKRRVGEWIGILGLSIAALVMSHNITSYIFLGLLVPLLLSKIFSNKSFSFPTFSKIFIGIILGLLASIYFWLPAIKDSRLMRYDTIFNYVDHFPTIKQLVTPYFGYGASVAGPGDGMSFFLGSGNLLLIVAGIVLFITYYRSFTKDQKTLIFWAIAVLAISVLMINHRSIFLWKSIPNLGYLQFPWRFLIVTTFVSPLFIIAFTKYKFSSYVGILIILATVVLNFSYFKPNEFLGRKDDYYLNRYIPAPDASAEYKKTQEEYLRLPKDTLVRPGKVYPRIIGEGKERINILRSNNLDATFQITSEKDVLVNYNKYYFPGWIAKIDDREANLIPGKPFGQIVLSVPAGIHKVEVKFVETNFKKVLDYISLATILMCFILIFKYRKA